MEVIIEKLSKLSDFKSKIFSNFEVDEKYEILEFLGSGTYGLVCSATDTSNGEKVAIKKLDDIFRRPTYTEKVIREVQIHSQINHPFIVSFKEIMRPVDINTFNDIYIVMEKVSENLHQSITNRLGRDRRHRSEAPLNVKLIMNQLLRALHYLHSANVLHRDLKPDNILIEKNQMVKLCDFGLARIAAPGMTETVIAAGYRPPELFLRHISNQSNYGPAVDIWSLGCIFADMLLERPSSLGFSDAKDDIDHLKKIAATIPPPEDDDLSEMIDNEQVRLYVKSLLPLTPSRPLRDLFVDVADKRAVDLLERMLVFNPGKRISAADALQHEYMAEITVNVLARKLNLKAYQVQKLQDLNPPHIEMSVQNTSQLSKVDLRKIVSTILFDRCVNTEAAQTSLKICSIDE